MRASRVLGISALVAGLAGCGGPGVSPDPSPARSELPPAEAPVPAPAEPTALAGLVAFDEAIHEDGAIRAALGLTARALARDAARAWAAGRHAWVEAAQRADLPGLAGAAGAGPPGPAVTSRLARLLLVERLLAHAKFPTDQELYPSGRDPGLARALARTVAVRFEPAMDGRDGATIPVVCTRALAALAAGGRSWKVLRPLSEATIPDGPGKGLNSRFLLQNPMGEKHEDPANEVPDLVSDGLYAARDRDRLAKAPVELTLPLAPVEGDLFLVLGVFNLFDTTQVVLELKGRDETTEVVVGRPADRESAPGPPPQVHGGLAVRVRREALPAGLTRAVLRMVALQPIGQAEPTANLSEIYQLASGPVPACFADHGWTAPPAPRPLDELAKAHLKATLAPLQAKLEATPADPDLHYAVGRAFFEAGRFAEARRSLDVALAYRPGHPPTLTLAGEVALELGEPDEALARWLRAYELEPAGRVRALLEARFPGRTKAPVRVATAAEFLRLAEFLADFRRQREVEEGLQRFNVRKAASIGLAEVNSASLVADLAKKGYLDRPGGPPSGKGFYRTDAAGLVSSSVYGSREAPLDPPPALVAGPEAKVEPAAILEALATRNPAGFEFGLPRLPATVLAGSWKRIAVAAAGLRDPWARDALLDALARELASGGAEAARPMAPWLESVARDAPEPARWRGLSLAWDLGRRDLPTPDAAETDRIFDAIGRGRLPRSLVPAALRGLPAGGRDFVVARLRSRVEPRFVVALDAARAFNERAVYAALVDALEGPMSRDWGDRIVSVLTELTRQDLGPDPEAWRKWLPKGG